MFLLITEKDPWGKPAGGQTTFAKHLIQACKGNIAVTSLCDDTSIPNGCWTLRKFEDVEIPFFSRGLIRINPSKKGIIPLRIKFFFNLRKYSKEIYASGYSNILIDAPETLFAIKKFPWENICYSFAGVSNPVSNSRYKLLQWFGKVFESFFINALNSCNIKTMIAAADTNSITEMLNRVNYQIDAKKIHSFPTRFDNNLFFPIKKEIARQNLSLPQEKKIIVTVGRLCWIKGWDLQLEAINKLKRDYPDILLVFVGNGEDNEKITATAKSLNLLENIIITGFVTQDQVRDYINASDLCTVASYKEGWSVAMCEILACEKPIVSTNVSGATSLIKDGKNGFVITNRSSDEFAQAINSTFDIKDAGHESLKISKKYSIQTLASDLRSVWDY